MPAPSRVSTATAEGQLRAGCAELQRRLQAGEPCRAEDFLASTPALAADPDLAVALICTEFAVRRELGQAAPPEEWYRRFPQWRDRLRRQLEAAQDPCNESPTGAQSVQSGVLTTPERAAGAPPHPTLGPRYDLEDELGRGGMGIVYRARDTVLGRVVAVKMIRTPGRPSPEELLRFRREAQAAARLRHPHILPLHDFGELAGQPYFTMPYLTGGSLARHLGRFGADPREAVALLEKVARAVEAAHGAGIVHRDLKPTNILLDEEGEPLVTDFGLAKFLDADADTEPTYTGQMLGTPAYMAPEQAAGHANRVTPASDVWALGVILYELLTGRRPFLGHGLEVSDRVRNMEPLRLRSLRPDLDRGLEAVVLTCLRKEPADRYGSAGALADDLARWQRGEPVAARRGAGWQGRWRPFRRLAPRLAIAALLALGVLGAGSLFLSHGFSLAPSPAPEDRAGQAALTTLQQDLAAGRPVTLVGAAGMPRYYRWRTEKQRPPLPAGKRGPLDVESWGTSLVELLPDPQRARYRLSAEVSHLSATNGWVGLYFAGDAVQTPDEPELRFGTLAFAERGDNAGQVRMDFECYHESQADGSFASGRLAVQKGRFNVPAGEAPWHALAVEVTTEKITTFWDGRPFYTWVRADQVRDRDAWWAKRHPFPNPPPPPEFAPRGELGLFVLQGRAQFRNVVVSPF